jgi:hypothetical protein
VSPLIQEMVGLEPEEALNYQWFDMTSVYKPEQVIDGDILEKPLPFPFTALVCAYEDKKVLLLTNRVGKVTAVVGWQLDKKSYKPTTPFTYVVEEEGVLCRNLNGSILDYRTGSATGVLAFIARFLESLDTQPAIGYMPTKRANWEKKIRQGKVPTYDWTTIVIEPRRPRSEDQGGTHASPRWHERRGHWRTLKSGKQVWVKNCAVGDKAKGAVFHDYQIKGNT